MFSVLCENWLSCESVAPEDDWSLLSPGELLALSSTCESKAGPESFLFWLVSLVLA